MKIFASLFACATALVLTLAACSKTDVPTAASASATAAPYDAVAATGKGFTVGALMSAQTVYVLFEPQCPHCGRLWQASVPLHNQVKFVWIPVAFNAGKSVAQAAALLTAPNPTEAMNAHEQSLLAGQGGVAEAPSVPDDLRQAIKANTQLLTSLGADSVPYLVAKHRKTGQVVTQNGALDTVALATLLGIN